MENLGDLGSNSDKHKDLFAPLEQFIEFMISQASSQGEELCGFCKARETASLPAPFSP